MSTAEFGHFVLTIASLLLLVHGLGYLAERLRQPRILGEILAGVLLGPFVLRAALPVLYQKLFLFAPSCSVVLGFLHQLGLVLLMFCSGASARRLLHREDRKRTLLLISISDLASFALVLGAGFLGWIPLQRMTGTLGQPTATLLILAIATAVTSIPVISRIFWDLGIMHTRFAGLMLGYAVLEDILLWVVLAFATGLAGAQQQLAATLTSHLLRTALFFLTAMFLMPPLLCRFSETRWNLVMRSSPIGYIMLVLLLYCGAAALLDVNLQFAALLAGHGIVGGTRETERERFRVSLESIAKVSFAVFIPIYFAMVGYRLVFGREFSFAMLLLFLVLSSAISIGSSAVAARLSGFRGIEVANIALTSNARGGPGIVLASVAFDAGIINAAFYTTLVITAVVTSQSCGMWLRYVLSRGWPLLAEGAVESSSVPEVGAIGTRGARR